LLEKDEIMSEFEWLLIDIRSDTLTEFFTMIPFMGSITFYMSLITIGFWLRPGGKVSLQLGVLIPLSILINLILKNSFAVLRPNEDLHLIQVSSMLGFPSSDTMIATIFWGIIALRWQKIYVIILSISMITIIFTSRIYLGVHSIADVVGGVAFGLITLVWWRSDFMQNIIYNKWLNKQISSYFGLILIVSCLYFLTVEDEIYSEEFSISIGALIGFGLSLKTIYKWKLEPGMFSSAHISSIAMSYIMLAILSIAIPTITMDATTKTISNILEHALLVFMIFCIFPRLQRAIARKEQHRVAI
jgi:hypothetical protein